MSAPDAMETSAPSRRAALGLAALALAAPGPAAAIAKGARGPQGPGFVYVFEVVGAPLAKIGFSRDPAGRMRRLAATTGLPLRLALLLPNRPHLEGDLHARFTALRISREWVRLEGAFADWLRAQTAP